LAHTVKLAAGIGEAWPFVVVGMIALVLGLLFLIRPRRSGEVWRSLSPYGGKKEISIGWIIANGCLFMLIAVAFLSASAVMLSR
jgi:hypothetical protein